VADGARTHDNRNHNPGLYQLSYSHHWYCVIDDDTIAGNKKGCKHELATSLFAANSLGWLMGLEPTTTGITILDSTN
jgi:hypothetical protein